MAAAVRALVLVVGLCFGDAAATAAGAAVGEDRPAGPELWKLLRLERPGAARHLRKAGQSAHFELAEDLIEWGPDAEGRVLVPLALPSGEVARFELRPNEVMPEALVADFPAQLALSGASVGFARQLFAEVDFSPVRGLRAMITDGDHTYFVDPAYGLDGGRLYDAYVGRAAQAAQAPGSGSAGGWDCEGDDRAGADAGRALRALSDVVGTRATRTVLTIALVASAEYAAFHGNSTEAALAEMVTVMNRVNGVLKREIGVALQLHERTADLICIECDLLPNNRDILDEMDDFIESAGVSRDSFDLGHSLTTGSGGSACIASACHPVHKACGTTGLTSPVSDAFYVDYVLHELAHQLGARHTFQDCPGKEPSLRTAVEPGSGSTIMSYAGICPGANLQSSSDAYFHAMSQQEMSGYLGWATSARGYGCGKTAPIPAAAALEARAAPLCTVPVGSSFRLGVEPYEGREYYYSFETMDSRPGAPLDSTTEPRFRSAPPSRTASRHFPSLDSVLHGGAAIEMEQRAPSVPTQVTFRATVRELFAPGPLASDGHASEGFGVHAFKDIATVFTAACAPLRFLPETHEVWQDVRAGDVHPMRWDASSKLLSPQVDLLFAEPTDRTAELVWRSLATLPNDGAAEVRVPRTVTGLAHFMVRSATFGDTSQCFFFDVLSYVKVRGEGEEPDHRPGPPLERPSKVGAIVQSSAPPGLQAAQAARLAALASLLLRR